MSVSVCSTCLFSSTSLLPFGGVALIMKIFGVSTSLLLAIVGCTYLLFRCLFNYDSGPAVLIGYPDNSTIEAFVKAQKPNETEQLLQPPLRASGRYIVDSTGKRIKLNSVNWYGGSDELFIPGGLEVQHRHDIAMTIRNMGFNSVRLPYSDEMVVKNPKISPFLLTANADLIGMRALDIYREVINALTDAGIAVIINNHITQARWCCDGNPCDAKWFNSHLGPLCPVQQTEENWIENLITISKPHIDNPLVVGIDLRNEVRGLTDRLLWDSWATAAENAAERLHLLQPEWLMIVEGVSSANFIQGARQRPVKLTYQDKLVYSAHVYGWSGWGSLSPYWRRPYNSFRKDMRNHWAWLLEENIAPVWVGEFGAPHRPGKGDLHYWQNLIRFLEECDADIGYWAINPRKPKDNELETYGLLRDDWKTGVYDYRLFDILRLAKAHHTNVFQPLNVQNVYP